MEDNETITLESAQQEYFEAVTSGDKEKVQAAQARMDSFLQPAPVEQKETLDKNESLVNNTESVETPQAASTEEQSTNEAVATEGDPGGGGGAEGGNPQAWLDSLDENIRNNVLTLLKERQEWEHRYRSNEGRINAAQNVLHQAALLKRENERIKRELEEVAKKSPVSTKPHPTDAASQGVPSDDFDADPDIEALKNTDEQLYRVIKKLRQRDLQEIQALKGELNTRLESSIKPLEEYRQEAFLQSELSQLQQVVPNAVDILRHPAWEEWKSTVPDRVRLLADSADHREVLFAMQLYGQWASQFNQQHQTQQPTETQHKANTVATTTNNQPVGSRPVNPAVQSFVAERNRKLQGQPVASQSIKPPAQARPSIEDIYNNPELYAQEQERIFKEELKKLGLAS